LWFDTQVDGIVREDATLTGDADPIPSLADAAAAKLRARHGDARPPGSDGPPVGIDPVQNPRRRPRFFDPVSLARATPREILADPSRLRAKVVIAGRSGPVYSTPVGALASQDLLANAFASHRDGVSVRTGMGWNASAWALALLTLTAMALAPRSVTRRRWLLPASGSIALLGLSGGAFYAASLWIAPAGPLALLLVTGTLMVVRRTPRIKRQTTATNLEAARTAQAAGDLHRAWWLYRSVPPTAAVLDELYEFANQLQRSELIEFAADVFHRIALVDAHFRNVADRLVAAVHQQAEAPALQLRGETPSALGRYELLAPIGQGSTGKVFLGSDPKINRLLAIKVIDLSAAYEAGELAEATDRFRREAETAGRLNHPNIVTVFDIGESDGLAYIAMEYLKGRHLSDLTRPDVLLPTALVLELAAQTADALHYAHTQNVVHRDIKPANIMYDSVSGSLKITDFGIARLIDVSRTRTGIVLGTPSFMAPEQLEGGNVNGHTDLFALGVSLYELLTGRLPFRGASMTKLMFVIANEPHQPITSVRRDLPEQLDALIDTALAKDPANRFQSGAEMADALRAVAGQLG
jgi:serine/threonine-protein kinase